MSTFNFVAVGDIRVTVSLRLYETSNKLYVHSKGGREEAMIAGMSRQALADSPVNLTLKESNWYVEIGFDLEKDRFKLKVKGVPFECFKRLVCR